MRYNSFSYLFGEGFKNIIKNGKDKFLSLYNNAINYSEYKLYHMRDSFDLSNIDEIPSLVEEPFQKLSVVSSGG